MQGILVFGVNTGRLHVCMSRAMMVNAVYNSLFLSPEHTQLVHNIPHKSSQYRSHHAVLGY